MSISPDRLYHFVAGDGPVVLLVNAAYQTADSWKSLVYGLRREFTVVAVDLPNQGKSPVALELQSIPEYSKSLLDFITYKGLNPRSLTCFGFSLGADILMDLRVNRGVAFQCTVAAGATPTGIDGYVNQYVNTQLDALRTCGVEGMARIMLQKVFSPQHYHQFPGAVDFAARSLKTIFDHRSTALESLLLATRPNPLTPSRESATAGHLEFALGRYDILYPLYLYADYGPGLAITPSIVDGGHAFAIEQPRETAAFIRRAFAASKPLS